MGVSRFLDLVQPGERGEATCTWSRKVLVFGSQKVTVFGLPGESEPSHPCSAPLGVVSGCLESRAGPTGVCGAFQKDGVSVCLEQCGLCGPAEAPTGMLSWMRCD